MIEIMQFTFSSFWVFLGTLILVGVVMEGLVALCAIIFARR